jgi:hypothetical protein
MESKRPSALRIIKWILIVLIAVRVMQLFVAWLTSPG